MTLTLEAGLVRANLPAPTLRSLTTLHAQALEGSRAAFTTLSNATAGILGQLAVLDAVPLRAVLGHAAVVARQAGTLGGFESVFLTAVLGCAPTGEVELTAAVEAWNAALPSVAVAGGAGEVPILDPSSGQLGFVDAEALHGLGRVASRADFVTRLKPLLDAPGGESVGRMAFARAVVVAAGAIAGTRLLTGRPAQDPLRQRIAQALGATEDGRALDSLLAAGKALLVDVVHLAAIRTADKAPGETLAPVVTSSVDAVHATWTGSRLRGTALPAGDGLAAQVLGDGRNLYLQGLPRCDDRGAVIELGFLRPLWTARERHEAEARRRAYDTAVVVGRPYGRRIPTRPRKLISLLPGLHPLTGVPVDPVTGLPLPGYRGEFAIAAEQLLWTAVTLRVSPEAPVGEVVLRMA
ncbi:hypothetical protein O7626_05035 [Micromonospora sp. WMMD1102]|uniref:hypothetical protein n=1 Tax=Micromonospora sp. WMMD1102 TaxID=3016105 RepID=UPI0024157851|nr:hypothetical protein [Micromonospora sp. WMMD1102]MDG4785301.1 hypothetical protein [Micromonospora sp. WMMD1102]